MKCNFFNATNFKLSQVPSSSPEPQARQILLESLFQALEAGDLTKAQNITLIDPYLLTSRTRFKDCVGRNFKSISPWEYLLYSRNTYYPWLMIGQLITQLSPEAQKELIVYLIDQYNELEQSGVHYELDTMEYQDSEYSLNELILAIEVMETKFVPVIGYSIDDQIEDWEKVGKLQNLLPKHFRFELCRENRRFDQETDFPSFHEQPFSSCLLYKYDMFLTKYEWKDIPLRGGVSLAFNGARLVQTPISVKHDINALKTLMAVRNSDYCAIKSELELRLKALNTDIDDSVKESNPLFPI
jgi:hypothetical protein